MTKRFRIDYYSGSAANDGPRLMAVFRTVAERNNPAIQVGAYVFQIRDLEIAANGRYCQGVFAKFRSADLPHVGAPGGAERELPIEANEGLIEKNHFYFVSQRQILTYQGNRHAGTAGQLGRYLTGVVGNTISFSPVLQRDAMQRLARGNLRSKSIELTVARPHEQLLNARADPLSGAIVSMLAETGGHKAHIRITPRRRNALVADVRDLFGRVMDRFDVTLAKVKVEDDGDQEMIDLITDRLTDYRDVEMNGAYPRSQEMFDALRECYGERRDSINAMVAGPDDAN